MPARWRFSVLEARGAEPEIIYRDAQLLIVNKPPGLPTTAPTSSEPCLLHWVRGRFPDLRPHATSRLDSSVSGVVTLALTREANQCLLQARRAGTYERIYLGITLREVSGPSGEWSWPISIDPQSPKRRVAGPGRGEREARTRYELAARAPVASLLRLMPQTGRTHQLRVHAARAGVPLFGDHAYGGERRFVSSDGAVVTARRIMLHCVRVAFPLTGRGEWSRFEAPVPADMTRIWLALGGSPSDLRA
jgi:23S rRNA-/tRNA-specific pseudouridylate synthase